MIYITGGTGFIGERLTRSLLERGEQVRCLVRSPERAVRLKQMGAELIVGDVEHISRACAMHASPFTSRRFTTSE
jgi:uncharacterized protein YbjT (DUF2867 family)